MRRLEALRTIYPRLKEHVVVTNMGGVAVELYSLGHRPNFFYLEHAMGLASSIGLGVALARPDRRVVIYDGDGNLLMNLGCAAMIAHTRPPNLIHVVFDNGVYASTGNQPAISRDVPLERVAAAAGYASSVRCSTPEATAQAFRDALANLGPSFILAEIDVETTPFTAARVEHTPEEIRDRFASAIAGATEE